MLKTTM